MSVWVGSVRVVVGSSADAARMLLKSNDEAFIDRPRLNIGLRRVLAPSAQALAHRAPQREAAQAARTCPPRGGEGHAARPARGLINGACGGIQGPPAHAQPQRRLPHGDGQEVRRGGGQLGDDAGGVPLDDRRAVRSHRLAQHRRRDPLA